MITREVTAWCDGGDCVEWVQGTDGLAALRASLKRAGWRFKSGRDYCGPDCDPTNSETKEK